MENFIWKIEADIGIGLQLHYFKCNEKFRKKIHRMSLDGNLREV